MVRMMEMRPYSRTVKDKCKGWQMTPAAYKGILRHFYFFGLKRGQRTLLYLIVRNSKSSKAMTDVKNSAFYPELGKQFQIWRVNNTCSGCNLGKASKYLTKLDCQSIFRVCVHSNFCTRLVLVFVLKTHW